MIKRHATTAGCASTQRSWRVLTIVLIPMSVLLYENAFGSARLPGNDDSPSLQAIIERVGGYVLAYGERMSLIVGVERYTQSSSGAERATRVLKSEIALVRIGNDWTGYRDVFEVDGRRLSDRTDRLERLFLDNPQTGAANGRQIADESARHNLGSILRNFNVPTTAMFFMQPSQLQRFKFKRMGSALASGSALWVISYEETRRPTIIRTSRGEDVPLRGTLWVDPATGRIHKTEMRLQFAAMVSTAAPSGFLSPLQPATGTPVRLDRKATEINVTVSYQIDERLGMLVPVEMLEHYQFYRSVEGTLDALPTTIDCRATYSEYKRFETNGRMVAPK